MSRSAPRALTPSSISVAWLTSDPGAPGGDGYSTGLNIRRARIWCQQLAHECVANVA
jgi:hypothetical protein